MTQIQHPGGTEPAFSNDPVADMVLHKDDDALLYGEAPGKETDVLPPNLPTEEWTGDGVNNGDCWFPIHFTYAGTNYTADVQQRTGVTKEFHVYGMTPAIDHLPEPYVVAEHISKEKYDFPINETHYPMAFGRAVVAAIEEGGDWEN